MVTCRAFTLIELLLVIAIIAILAGLLLVAAGALGIGSKRQRTDNILAVIRTGLELVVANGSARPAPAEHPLAASREPRPAFSRAATSPAITPCASAGMALRGIPAALVMSRLSAGQGRVLLDDDRFSDGCAPQYFGVERGRLGLLGAGVREVTLWRKLPPTLAGDPDSPANRVLGLLVEPQGGAADHGAVIDQVFSVAGTRSELVALGAMLAAPATHDQDFGSSCPGHLRLKTDIPSGQQGDKAWRPGSIRDGTLGWKSAAIPGTILVDAWGREILYSLTGNGSVVLESAGADGCFRFHPGPDLRLDTSDPFADAPSGDDRDGAEDNRYSRPGG